MVTMAKRLRSVTKRIYLALYKAYHGIPSGVRILGPVNIDASDVTFGSHVTIWQGTHIWGTGKIVIGDNVAIGNDVVIYSDASIHIGNDTSIAGQAYIIDSDHGSKRESLMRLQPLVSQPIIIGCDVWIGAGAKILRGSNVGDGAIVGAQALVKGDIDPYSVYVGVPAKKVGSRV